MGRSRRSPASEAAPRPPLTKRLVGLWGFYTDLRILGMMLGSRDLGFQDVGVWGFEA